MNSLFGTDGIRGEAGRFPLDSATVKRVGESLAYHLRTLSGRDPLIVIGRDTRESGPWLESALTDGAVKGGARCQSAGVITTPGVAYLTRRLAADAGVVLSASHNPYRDNGIKIFSPSGQKLDDRIETLIEADISGDTKDVSRAASEAVVAGSLPHSEEQLRQQYLSFLSHEVGYSLSLQRLHIIVDCANGASSLVAPLLFQQLGANVIAINDKPDGRNINLNCGSLHIKSLADRVAIEHADLGIAFDGDADRALFIDANGKLVDGDATLWVLANYLQQRKELSQNIVVATVMSNIGLELALGTRDIRLVRTDVGDKYVLEELLRLDASLGGEQSGHIILPAISLAGDGMITALMLLRATCAEDNSLSNLTEGFTRYPQILLNVPVREKLPFDEISEVAAAVHEIENKLNQNGRLLLRYSGTEPLARIMIEGANQSEIEGYAQSIASVIEKAIGL
ncbi:MAG: phosphoglucosamine mutase [Pyrinomonadaceae bacterium]